jgi:ABC-type branched-subunit amino acid transport system substrate-binding protein
MIKKLLLVIAALALVVPVVACRGPAPEEVVITTASLPQGIFNNSYGTSLAATGGTGECIWSVASGALPDGLSLSTGGAISGTPTSNGTCSFTVQATSGEATATKSLSILVHETVPVGCVCTKTGDLGPMGIRMFQGAELAAAEINAQGGINGALIELLEEDDATDPAKSLERVKKLAEVDGVKVSLGAWFGGSSQAVAPYAEANKIVMVSPSCTLAPSILYEQGWREYVFHVCLHDGLQAQVLAGIAHDNNYTRAAAIVQDTPYGVGLGEAFFDALDEYNITHMDDVVTYDRATKDYLTQLEQIKTWGPDVVLLVSYCDDGIIVFKQASELGMGLDNGIAWLGCDGNYGSGMFEDPVCAEFMANSLVAGTSSAGPSPEEYAPYGDFIEAYNATYGEAPEVYCDHMYDCVKLIAAAVEKAGIYDSEAIRDALMEVGQDYQGAAGVLSWDEGGNRISGTFEIWKVRKTAAGKYENYRVELVPIE